MKKFLCTIFCLFAVSLSANATFEEHYNLAQQYLSQYQYSSAIGEFKKALRINYLDNSARIGLVNAYLARGTYLANKEKNWEGACNDYRAALFYLKYYPTSNQEVQNSAQAIANAVENLGVCLGAAKFSTAPQNRYDKAKELRADGLFPEAGYEFAQAMGDFALKQDSYEQMADIMKVLGNDPKAAEYYQKAVAMDQNDAGLRLKYARVLDRLDKNEAAVEEYNFALSKGGNDPEILFALERIYRQKLAQTPNDAEVMANLGAILQKQGKFDEALQYYTQAGVLNPSNVTTRLNVGTLYQQRKSYDAAIAAYDTILVLYPEHVEANYYKAQCLAAMGQNDKAIEMFKRVASLDPTNKDANIQIFEIMKNSMTPAQMLDYFEKNAATDKGAIDAMYDYALDLHKQNKFDDAITYYSEVIKLRPSNPEVFINLSIAYNQKQDSAQASKVLQDALLRFPNNKQIMDAIKALTDELTSGKIAEAADYYAKQEYQKAIDCYKMVNPPTFDSMSGIAISYKALNNDEQALEYYKKALALNSSSSDTAYYIGVLYSEKEDWAQSKIYLKRAMALNKNNTRAKDLYQSVVEQANVKLLNDAIAFYDKKEYVQALKSLNQILAEDSKNAYAYYYRGMISDDQKKYALAIADYKKAVQYAAGDPELTIVNYLIGLDYDTLLQYQNALPYYKKYITLTKENNEYKIYAQSRVKALKEYEPKK